MGGKFKCLSYIIHCLLVDMRIKNRNFWSQFEKFFLTYPTFIVLYFNYHIKQTNINIVSLQCSGLVSQQDV